MKILLLSPWKNVWVDYMLKYFNGNGHKMDFNRREFWTDYDILLSGWCDQHAANILKYQSKAKKVCFVRSYEFYHGLTDQIPLEKFDKVFVLNHFIQKHLGLGTMTRNGIDLDRIKLTECDNDKTVLFLADINHKKGIQLLLQIVRKCPEFTFYIAGNIQERRFGYYLDEHTRDLPNIHYLSYVQDIQNLFENKTFIMSCSPAEGNPNNVIEGMAAGLTPVLHTYLGHEGQFPTGQFYETVDEAVELLKTGPIFKREANRAYVKMFYDMNKVYKEMEGELCKLLSSDTEKSEKP